MARAERIVEGSGVGVAVSSAEGGCNSWAADAGGVTWVVFDGAGAEAGQGGGGGGQQQG